MLDLACQRCRNHAEREAVARCPTCNQFFCRECITEHDDRVICANCLRRLSHVPLRQRPAYVRAVRLGQGLLGLMLVWFFFYLLGESLLALPTSFHEGTLWQVKWWHSK